MKIEDLLDTSIMQVLDIETAREQAMLLWKKLSGGDDALITSVPQKPAGHEKVLDLNASASTGEQILHEVTEASFTKSEEELNQPQDMEKNILSGVALDKLNLLLDIPLKVSVVLGRAKNKLKRYYK